MDITNMYDVSNDYNVKTDNTSVYRFEFSNGKTKDYFVYNSPDSPNVTSAMVMHRGNGNTNTFTNTYFDNLTTDSVVILPVEVTSFHDHPTPDLAATGYYDGAVEQAYYDSAVVNELEDYLGKNFNQVSFSGTSASGIAPVVAGTYNTLNTDSKSHLVVLVDPYCNINLKPSDITDDLKRGLEGVNILTFSRPDMRYEAKQIEKLYGEYANVIAVTNKTWWNDHGDTIAKTFKDNIVDFMSGDDLLNIDNYTFYLYNPETESEEIISYEDLKKLIPDISPEEVYAGAYKELVGYVQGLNEKYFGSGSEWKWNNDTLAGELQDLVSKISNLEYMKNESAEGYSSTTELPNAEAEKQQVLYANVTGLLSRIGQIVEAAYAIQDSIQVTEKTKAEEASELDNGKTTTTSGGTGLLGLFGAAVEKGKEWWETAKDGLINIALKGLPFLTNPLISPSINSGARTFQRILTLGLAIFGGGKEDSTEEKEPLGHGGGGQAGGGSGTGGKPTETEQEKPSSNTGGGYHGGGGSYGGGSTPSPEVEKPEEYDIKKDFPEWDDVYTDEHRLVYESEEGYKVVIHHNDEEIIGVEHYYDFKTEESAKENYEKVINDYINEEYADVVIRKEQYIKMVYKEESYSGISLSKFKERFEDLKLVEKNKN